MNDRQESLLRMVRGQGCTCDPVNLRFKLVPEDRVAALVGDQNRMHWDVTLDQEHD